MSNFELERPELIRRMAILWVVVCWLTPWHGLQAQSGHKLLSGARGVVRTSSGEPLEGIMVQLIAQKNGIRTTVYSNENGGYEFPKLATGAYTLRIAKPLEYQPYVKEAVQINGSPQLEPIVLERVTKDELLPPTPEIATQLAGAEWMLNLPGTGQEKRTFTWACGFGCHSYQQIFRNRYDEQSWGLILERMLHYAGSPLINRSPGRGRLSPEDETMLVKWLARVRGPDSKDMPFHVLPPPSGAATRAIVTEYELPRTLLAPHDVHGDSEGNIWYSPHRSPYIGKLDPRTGVVTEFRHPETPGALPGTHRIWVDKRDNEETVWASENWAHNLDALDPKTGKFRQFHIETDSPTNSPGFSNFALDPQGYVYETEFNAVIKIDPKDGHIVKTYPLQKIRSTYDNMVSPDGKFWSGGQGGSNLIGLLDLESGKLDELHSRSVVTSPARGGFDFEDNAWYGGRGGQIIRLNAKTKKLDEFYPPTPYITFYEVLPDKNGEIWGGELHGGRFVRFNPKTERWIEYVLPEPFSHNRRTWIDNSTDPVTIWYVDHNGYIVRIQPLE